jgi:hypothetical protein
MLQRIASCLDPGESIAAVERLTDSNKVHEADRSVIKSQKEERGVEYVCE